jgi:hypothetical protein
MVSESLLCLQKQVEYYGASFAFTYLLELFTTIHNEHKFMFYKTEEYEGFLVVKYHCIRKTYCLNLQSRALLSVIFTLKT